MSSVTYPSVTSGPGEVQVNVLLIVSDTVRPDYLGINGGPTRTPNLDTFARSSVYFRRAFANSFPTVPARADYLTGTYAFTEIGWGPLPRKTSSVVEALAADGVTTIGVADTPFYVANGFNYDRGFQYFYDLPTQDLEGQRHGDPRIPKRGGITPAPRLKEYDYCAPHTMTTAEIALERLVDKRFFMLVDTWDPHEPWDPPAYYVKRYKPDYDGRVVEPVYGPYAEYGLTEDDMETARACYAAELEMVDRWTGRLLERLESLGLAEETTVIFVSDHGFYFGEHGGIFGKMVRAEPRVNKWLRSPLYGECSNVPLMIRLPGVEPRFDDRLVAAAIHIAPTILDLFGLEQPEQMLGRSLVPLVRSSDEPADDITVTAMPLAAPGGSVRVVDDLTRVVDEWQPITLMSRDWMMLFSRWDDPIELYAVNGSVIDAPHGPNLAADRPDVVKDLHGKLIAELQRAGASDDAIQARS